MSKKIAINGFGRIGRLTTRILLTRFPDVEIVAVNDLTSPDNLAYLLEHDSTYRKFGKSVKLEGDQIVVETEQGIQRIKVLSERDPSNLPWGEMGIDVVIESTGIFRTKEMAGKHLEAGAKRVVISAPAKGEGVDTLVLGVKSDFQGDIVSNASCTTNCIAPAFKVLNDTFGIKQAFGITTHAYTATQALQDSPTKKDFRDGRAAAVNAIPSSTGAANAVVKVLPELSGKLSLSALRIPVITGSMVYVTAEVEKTPSVESVNKSFMEAATGPMKGVLEYSESDLVSSDIIMNPHSSIYDSKLTEVMGNTIKFVVWYDNEWGYSNRLAEVVAEVC